MVVGCDDYINYFLNNNDNIFDLENYVYEGKIRGKVLIVGRTGSAYCR